MYMLVTLCVDVRNCIKYLLLMVVAVASIVNMNSKNIVKFVPHIIYYHYKCIMVTCAHEVLYC